MPLGLLCLLEVPPCPPTPTAGLLPLKESWTLGVAKPWSLALVDRQPRVSRVTQRMTLTTGMVGTHLSAKVEGSPGAAEPAKEVTAGRDISLLHPPIPCEGC